MNPWVHLQSGHLHYQIGKYLSILVLHALKRGNKSWKRHLSIHKVIPVSYIVSANNHKLPDRKEDLHSQQILPDHRTNTTRFSLRVRITSYHHHLAQPVTLGHRLLTRQ